MRAPRTSEQPLVVTATACAATGRRPPLGEAEGCLEGNRNRDARTDLSLSTRFIALRTARHSCVLGGGAWRSAWLSQEAAKSGEKR